MRQGGTISFLAQRGRVRDRSGFTLIEVTLALMLIALLAAVALPGLVRPIGPASLRIAAMQIAALLREDRNVAIKTGYLVTSQVEAREIRSGASRAAITLPAGTMAGVVGAPMQAVRFYGDGHASGGTILLVSQAARIGVSISPDTGAIRVDAP